MSAPTKIVSAKRQAGAMALGLMQSAERDVQLGRESMRWTRSRFGGLSKLWMSDYRATKLAIEHLRAARILYDKLPRYAK